MIFGMKIGSIFSYKLKRGLAGRRQSCENVKSKINKNDRVIWMHAASLGEYEQGLPVLEQLKREFPNHKILITFFSPSGYENVAGRNHIADAVAYLPFDLRNWVEEFTSHFHADIFFTVKYDYWYNLLQILKQKGTKIYVVSAYFYETQLFFMSYGGWFVEKLSETVSWFFHQTKHSTALAKSIGLKNSSTAGDTRFDRVKKQLNGDNSVPYIEDFVKGKQAVVFGSSWEAEERMAEIIVAKNKNVKLIIAPHDLKRVQVFKEMFPNCLFYSDLQKSYLENQNFEIPDAQVLIIDCIGLLSKLYSYADVAVVGGGFHSAGLHNILEACTFGIPVIFGNHYKEKPEADDLIAAGGGKYFEDEFFAGNYLLTLLSQPDIIKKMGESASEFVTSQPDSTAIIIKKILSEYQAKNL